MQIRPHHTHSRWLFLALVLVLLGTQVLQAGHLHAHHGLSVDCVQCQADSGQAMAITRAAAPACLPLRREIQQGIAAAPIASYCRPTARGPPVLSS